MNTPVGIEGLGQVAISVSDLSRAVAFYRDVLGLEMLLRVPRMAFFGCTGVRLALVLPEGDGPPPACSILYFRVEDTDASEGALRAAGVEILAASHRVARLPFHELWMAFFRDSEGNTMALMAEKALSDC